MISDAEHEKQLWLDGAPIDRGLLRVPGLGDRMCPCCIGMDGIDPNGSADEWDVLEDMGFPKR